MRTVTHITLVLVIASAAVVRSEEKFDAGDLKSEASRQKIYDIISSHEDRKYGDHGGHEYGEGEIPRKSASRKQKRYGYEPDGNNYYYLQQSKPLNVGYEPKVPADENVYVAPLPGTVYQAPKGRYPVVETSYEEPQRGYISYDDAYGSPKKPESIYVAPKKPEAVYITRKKPAAIYAAPKSAKEVLYHENDGAYIEDKTAPITIGKTAHTVYPRPLTNSHYSVVDPHAPSEYVAIEGQNPPRPLILDPKLKETYHHQHPVAHYSAPEHQIVAKPKISAPVYYEAPAKDYVQYDSHRNEEDKGHHETGHGYYKDNAIKEDSGHKSQGHHEVAGHKAHSSVADHHDEHDHHHNKAHYEHDRGYHYEKAYAYDRVRAHHDIGSTRGAQSSYNAHHGQEGHKDAGHHGGETYSYFKKDDHGSGYGYQEGNSLYKKGHGYYGQKFFPTYYHG